VLYEVVRINTALVMGDSCCVCGLVLATTDSGFPQWCKDIRACMFCWKWRKLNTLYSPLCIVCQVNHVPTLTDIGNNDNDAIPYNFPIPSLNESRRYYYCCRSVEIDQTPDYCYPFHTACWALLEDIIDGTFSIDALTHLYNIFEGFHYSRMSRCLKWGRNYCFEDMLDSDSTECILFYQR
jgi:hypothetical protein